MSTTEVVPEDFQRIADEERSLQSGSTRFSFHTSEGVCEVTWYSFQGRAISTSLTVPEAYMASGGHVAHNDGVSRAGEGAGEFVYPAARLSEVQEHIARRVDLGVAASVPVRELPPEERVPTAIGMTAVAELIQETDPRNILFYTGAGMSGGGEFPVRDYHALTDECGFVPADREAQDLARNEAFVRTFLSDPEKPKSMLDSYQGMLDVIFRDASTPAHVALAAIARSMDLEPSFLTTNYDLKHEGEGSRIKVPKILHAWNDPDWPGLSPQHKERNSRAQEAVERLQEEGVDLLVATGVAADRRGAIDQIDAGAIVAINGADPSTLPYLSKEDYYLQADAQTAWPAIARTLRELNGNG